MTSSGLAMRILLALPLWLRRPFIMFSVEVVSTIQKGLPAAEILALSYSTTLDEDPGQMLFDLSMRKLDREMEDAPKPPPKDSTLLVLAGPHKGRLATMGISNYKSPREVELLVSFSDRKLATLSCSDVKEIIPPKWQNLAAETKPTVGDLFWGACVKQQNIVGPALTVWKASQSVDALLAKGYTKWMNSIIDVEGILTLSE
jgi:hypothetical protein